MIGLLLCVLALISTFAATRRSLGHGFGVALFWGYVTGILRANLVQPSVQFIFDVAIGTIYLAQLPALLNPDTYRRISALRDWVLALVFWPTLLMFVGLSSILISLAGLRYANWYLGVLLIGALFTEDDLILTGRWLAVLNLGALLFGVAEYILGVPMFYPRNIATEIIYRSGVGQEAALLRIPATFLNAHCYGGAMVCSLPFIWYAYLRKSTTWTVVLIGGAAAAGLGVLLSATRSNFVLAAGSALLMFARHRSLFNRKEVWPILIITLGVACYAVARGDERTNRFEELGSSETLRGRLYNPQLLGEWMIERAAKYPMGRGLAYGISIPYFLINELPADMRDLDDVTESEFGRILITQGILGLFLWLGFLVWLYSHRTQPAVGPSASAYTFMYFLTLLVSISGIWSVGCLSALPMAALLFLMMGLVARGPITAGAASLRSWTARKRHPAAPPARIPRPNPQAG